MGMRDMRDICEICRLRPPKVGYNKTGPLYMKSASTAELPALPSSQAQGGEQSALKRGLVLGMR